LIGWLEDLNEKKHLREVGVGGKNNVKGNLEKIPRENVEWI
jgi:hypothetical protein